MSYHILIIEDDPDDLLLMRIALEREQPNPSSLTFECDSATTLADAERMLSVIRFDAALLDLNLPDGSGIELPQRLLAGWPKMPVVIVTGMEDRRKEEEIVRLPTVQDFLRKSELARLANPGMELGRRIHYAIMKHKRRVEMEEKYDTLLRQIGVSV